MIKEEHKIILEKLKEYLPKFPGVFEPFSFGMPHNKAAQDLSKFRACLEELIPLADPDYAAKFMYSKDELNDKSRESYGLYDYVKMTENIVSDNTNDWFFLFSFDWSSDVDQAVRRIDYLLKNGCPPKLFFNNSQYDGTIFDFSIELDESGKVIKSAPRNL